MQRESRISGRCLSGTVKPGIYVKIPVVSDLEEETTYGLHSTHNWIDSVRDARICL
jgi:hypothetical protein